ncbi:GGDEF domain-containing protein [Dyella sp. 2HG41-7]|uniref:tetratricopeptide repeat-containing diguanylate cyclase n=1 Tax=Dyella sp. 2HG41-7 TaxID=2883239 RepID=UPI001F21C9E1|nr:GGDEF domain-containing protein [Dyella sp. 2HG41-7]
MLRLRSRFTLWPIIVAMAWSALVQVGYAAMSISNPAEFLEQAESVHAVDHARFVQMLAQIHREAPPLKPAEQWHLRYLDAWEAMFEGDYAKSETELRDVIDHSGDPTLAAKALAQLMDNLATNRRYEEAFAMANRLTAGLSQITDRKTRFWLFYELSQMSNYAGQIDLAIQYAHMAADSAPPGSSLCFPYYLQVAALYNGKRLTSGSPELHEAIETCDASKYPVTANAAWLILVSLHLDENQPAKAMALLDHIEPAIRASHYYPHMLSSQVQRAQAYAELGDDNSAKTAALAAIGMSHPNEISEWLMVAYDVLYKAEKKLGHSAAALSYYEHYAAQDKGYLDDISARSLAYEVAQQNMLMQKFETERLSKQNNILRLQQQLATKAVETSRLYIVLLIMVLVFIVFWLFRLKRSQLRFKILARLDGLTGVFNHQHFIGEAERALRGLEKKHGVACLISIDLDHFKQVNDTHGHAIGDAVLKHTVAICKQHLRPTDLFGRLGGEEFGILLMGCSRDQGAAIADRIRMAIEATPMDKDECVVAFSASIGLVSTETCGYDLHQLWREADSALYRAKRTGRNRLIVDTGSDVLLSA